MPLTSTAVERPTRVRHIVLWLTVAAYMVTYMDRVMISSAVPEIRKELGISIVTMAWVLGSFRVGYSLFQIPGGWVGDKIGPRRALALIVTLWSAFTSLTALSWNAASMAVFRFLFGVGEAGAFPIATRSLSRWMLPTERGYAQGITHAGSRLGAAVTPIIVVWLMANYGWRMPFFVFGLMGIVWAVVWFLYYRDTPDEHRSVNAAERHLISSAIGAPRTKTTAKVPWRVILRSSNVWMLSSMYFCYGYGLALYLDWFPTYLNSYRNFTLKEMGFYASLPLLAGTLGDFLGGWISDRWAHRSGNLVLARRGVAIAGFLIAAAGIIPATLTGDPYLCVVFTCIAFFGLEVTVGVSWAIPLDIGGDYAGSVSAVMNMCGNSGGAISAVLAGYLVNAFGWNAPFLVASVLCVIAAVLFLRVDPSRRVTSTPVQ